MDVDDLLAEQRAYYRARAPEYDDWWRRFGRYDRGDANTEVWLGDVAEAEARLNAFAPTGRVLELAAGTGNWTTRLVEHADRVTAVDASPETLAINREKLGAAADRVDYVEADLFAWAPTDGFDVVFMGFWLTHVPDSRFDAFWEFVAACLRPDGRVFVLDNCHPQHQANVPGSPVEITRSGISGYDGTIDTTTGIATRNLADGREFTIVKRYWEPDELITRLAALGWAFEASTTGHFFITAHGARA